ncbi:MAG: CocE/NonD family hydrolase [Dehalococcoidia bacterium]
MVVILVVLALIGFTCLLTYHYRRSLIARLMGLPPPVHGAAVRRNIPVPMPDGVQLLIDLYSPRAQGTFPTIFIRTPYGRGREAGLAGMILGDFMPQRFAERGYNVVVQGARGRFDSGGEFDPHINEAADGQATLEWIGQQPWFSGELGTWGPSYLGYAQWAMAAGAPPFLKAMVPGIASPENLTVTHPDGAFGLDTRLQWICLLHTQARGHGQPLRKRLSQMIPGRGTANLEAAFAHLPLLEADIVATGDIVPFYRELLRNTLPDQPYWRARDHSTSVSQVSVPVCLIGGWYDYYLRGVLATYATLRASGQCPHLTIGPWYHPHPGAMRANLREGLAWFEAHLKGNHDRLCEMPVRVYIMGAREWRELHEWPPPASETRYFLQPDARLSREAPIASSAPDQYRYDPTDPPPAVGGARFARSQAGAKDNRSLEARPDVLCYTTPPLASDVEVIGPVRLELFVRSSLAHTDFFGRLCDVRPDGRSTNVCDGLFRIEPGNGEQQPDGSLRIDVDMWATAYRFGRGHRLRLQVSSGAHPRWSRNLGTGEPIATGTRMNVAEQAVYHDEAHPSALVLPMTDG